MSTLDITVRYTRELVDSGQPSQESHLKHGELRWQMPVEQAALVLVDCWNDFVLQSITENNHRIGREKIQPAVEASRKAGVAVIHAPSAECARNYPQWRLCADDADLFAPEKPADPWPPPEFRRAEGPYAAFRVPRIGHEPMYTEWRKRNPPEAIRVMPFLGPKPEDYVVATGAQLHRLCRHMGILHLFYAGFAANICVQHRDCGMRPMRQRGYNVILLRDCTRAIEQPETLDGMWMTFAAVSDLELKVGSSTTSEELQRACMGCEAR